MSIKSKKKNAKKLFNRKKSEFLSKIGLGQNDTDSNTDEKSDYSSKDKLFAFCRKNNLNRVDILGDDGEQYSGLNFNTLGKPLLLTETTIDIYNYIDKYIRFATKPIRIKINNVLLTEILKSA